MSAWKSLASLLGVIVLASAGQAQTYTLQEQFSKEHYFHVELDTTLKGKLLIQKKDKVVPLEQTVSAKHDFVERVLQTGNLGVLVKTARLYKEAQVSIEVGETPSKRSIRPNRYFMVVQRNKSGLLAYSPNGPLTREELDVTHHFDVLAVAGLLPGKEVAVGDSWKVHNAVAQALCYFDGLTSQDLVCKLVGVENDKATVSFAGTANGIDMGAAVKLKIDGIYHFDLKSHRIVSLEWNQQDERGQGPVSPEINAQLVIKMTRTPIDPFPELSDIALVRVPSGETPPESLTGLSYSDPEGRYELTVSRDWITVARTDHHLVMRCLERGEFVAQVTATVWPKTEPGKHLSGEEFQSAMNESPGWEPDEIQEAKEVDTETGYFVYRISATGKLSGVKTLQYFYLIAGPKGEQMVLAFALTPDQAQKLGNRDFDLVRSLEFPGSPKEQVIIETP